MTVCPIDLSIQAHRRCRRVLDRHALHPPERACPSGRPSDHAASSGESSGRSPKSSGVATRRGCGVSQRPAFPSTPPMAAYPKVGLFQNTPAVATYLKSSGVATRRGCGVSQRSAFPSTPPIAASPVVGLFQARLRMRCVQSRQAMPHAAGAACPSGRSFRARRRWRRVQRSVSFKHASACDVSKVVRRCNTPRLRRVPAVGLSEHAADAGVSKGRSLSNTPAVATYPKSSGVATRRGCGVCVSCSLRSPG